MRPCALLLALTLAALAPLAEAQPAGAGLQVAPVIINMTAERPTTHFSFRNGRTSEAAFEVIAFAWSQENGESVLEPTTDLIVSPSTFLTGAGASQIVRVALSPGARGEAHEQTYRLLVRELPTPTAHQGLRILVEMSLPVFIAQNGANGRLSVRRTTTADGQPGILFYNAGDAHVALSPAQAGGVDPPRYLLAGAQAVRPLQPGVANVRLLVADRTDAPAQERAFDLTDAPVLADSR